MGWIIQSWNPVKGKRLKLLAKTFTPSLRSTQPSTQWVTKGSFLEVRQTDCEVDHSPPSSVAVKDVWHYNFTPPICLYGVYRDNITFSLNSVL